jgi:ATPase subunit of ABC transporter with duplicated ATPase domains
MLSTSVVQHQDPFTGRMELTFDTAKLWKQAYERSEREKAELQDYVNRFEKRRLEAAEAEKENSRKRKDRGESPAKANIQSKRRELEPTTPVSGVIDINADLDGNGAGKQVANFEGLTDDPETTLKLYFAMSSSSNAC